MGRILEDISQWPIEKRRAKIEEIYKRKIGVPLNLDNPQRFTEKTQWRKLYEDDPKITRCIDKLTFKQYVREKLGDGYTAPLIDVWHSPEDVDLNTLPNKCVVKSNCSGAGRYLIMVFDKSQIDIDKQNKEIAGTWFNKLYLHTNSFFSAYYPISPCVIAEEMISEVTTGVDEYKFLCFDGEPYCLFHADKRFKNGMLAHPTLSFFDLEWNNLGVRYGQKENNPFARRPKYMQEMIEICRVLSEGFPYVRVDFYETDHRWYLSEMTFTIDGGMIPFDPESFDFELGDLWKMN